jgi:flavin reductase (DIM6/NTAB) family NADH-FMN oxidoreductase RutF
VIAAGVPDPPATAAAEAATAGTPATATGSPATVAGAVDQARFRQVLGHFATGVTVVTGRNPAGPVGLAVNSFTSVSLDPPLVAFSVNRRSTTWPLLRAAGRFTVNILGADQEAVCRRFASTGRERFEGVGWRPSPGGSPVLDGALAWIDALVEVEHDAGDHLLVVGRVTGLDVVREGAPLVFYRGGYGRFEL